MIPSFRVLRLGAQASIEMFLAKYPPRILAASWIPRVIFQTLFFVLLVGFARGPEAMQFALIGNAIGMAAAVALVQVSGIIGEERQAGLLGYLMAVPANRVWIIIGRCTAFFLDALISALLALFVVGSFIGAFPNIVRVVYALPIFLLICASLSAVGLLIGSAALLTRQSSNIANLVYYLFLVMCGVNYPVDALPAAARTISALLPMTHGLEALRAILATAAYGDVLPALGWEAALGAGYAAIAYVVFQLQVHRARATGSTEFV